MRAALEMTTVPQLNLLVAWVCLCLTFVSGLILGLFFHRENWLGGYGSFRRRLYRLGHISFFGLGIVNLAFYLTAKAASLSPSTVRFAGWGFVIGAVSMPLCCLLMAHFPRTRPLFGVPVMSLLLAGSLVMVGLVHPRVPVSPRVPPVTSQSLTEEFPSRTYLVEVGPARRAGRSPESGRLGEPSLPSRDIDELSSRLDYIQCSNVSTLFRFNASTFNASTFRIP